MIGGRKNGKEQERGREGEWKRRKKKNGGGKWKVRMIQVTEEESQTLQSCLGLSGRANSEILFYRAD